VVAATPAWDQFVERSGVATSLALLLTILALSVARLHPTALSAALAGPQLLLILVVLGCVAVLAFRRDAD
jgi:hypothetical protein